VKERKRNGNIVLRVLSVVVRMLVTVPWRVFQLECKLAGRVLVTVGNLGR